MLLVLAIGARQWCSPKPLPKKRRATQANHLSDLIHGRDIYCKSEVRERILHGAGDSFHVFRFSQALMQGTIKNIQKNSSMYAGHIYFS